MLFAKRHSTKIIHIFIWVMLLHLIFDLSGIFESIIALMKGEYIDEGIIVIPSLIALFYFNLNILIPRFMKVSAWFKYILFLALLMILLMGIGSVVLLALQNSGVHSYIDLVDFFDYSLVFYLVTMGISTSIGFSKIAAQKEVQKKEALEKQKVAEMKFLSTQVSPHFLFNSLNSIYSLAEEEDASLTSNAILKLSEMMRYPFTDGMQEKVKLQKEIDFIKNYISLQKIKLGDDFPVTLELEIQNLDLEIAPLLLVPIVENAFKYGISRNSPQPIIIRLASIEKKISLNVTNSIFQRSENISSKVGLKNLQERLELIYTSKHDLKMTTEKNQFNVQLDIFV